MLKYLIFLSIFITSFSVAQSKYTQAQVEKSTDVQVIANFIKYNPTHPKTPEFKRKLLSVMNNDKPAVKKAAVAKPTIKPISTSTLKTEIKKDVAKNGPSEANKRTADLLNHIFNTDPSSKTAYVQIINKSKCNLIVKISGKKYYNLDVPANNENFILVDKGNYSITTSVCDAKYSSTKNISRDIVVTLNAPRTTP